MHKTQTNSLLHNEHACTRKILSYLARYIAIHVHNYLYTMYIGVKKGIVVWRLNCRTIWMLIKVQAIHLYFAQIRKTKIRCFWTACHYWQNFYARICKSGWMNIDFFSNWFRFYNERRFIYHAVIHLPFTSVK